jgi:aspartate aminotransferase
VLDLFAGTGAIGIEALSRGARHVTFVESHRSALAALDKNLASLCVPSDRFEIERVASGRALADLLRAERRFDLIFADPPYAQAQALLPEVLEGALRLLAGAGTVILELSSSNPPPRPPPGLRLTRARSYGETSLAFYARETPSHTTVENVMPLTSRLNGVAPSATLTLAQKARELAEQGRDVVNLTIGEPDFPTPRHVVEAMKRALDRGETKYTAVAGIDPLRRAIAERMRAEGLAYDPAEVIVSTGAKQSIFNAVLALIDDGLEAIVSAPYWLSYPDMVRFAGGKVVTVPTLEEDGFVMTPDALERAITDKTRVLFLNSPSNPAGALYEAGDLRAIAEVLERHPQVVVISDEIYDCFVYDGGRYASLLGVAPELKPRVLVVNGCSKRYAMTGLRIGWALGPRALISAMGRIQGQSTSNPCTAAQHAALAAITGDQTPVREMVAAFDVRRRFVIGRLGGIPGVTCYNPRGAFYAFPNISAYLGRTLPDGSPIEDGFAISAYLLHEHGLVVIPGGPFGAPNHIRLSFAADMDTLARGLDRLRTALVALGS